MSFGDWPEDKPLLLSVPPGDEDLALKDHLAVAVMWLEYVANLYEDAELDDEEAAFLEECCERMERAMERLGRGA